MENSIIQAEAPYKESIESLAQAEEAMSIALSFIGNECVAKCINEQVYHTLYHQTLDPLNGVRLCLDPIKDFVERDHSSTEKPIALKVVE